MAAAKPQAIAIAAPRRLLGALAKLTPDNLLQPLDKSWLTPDLVTRRIDLAVDIATHDLYHAGQISLLKKAQNR